MTLWRSLRAAREFAKEELVDHKHVMGLHDHRANPHVHIGVRAEYNSERGVNEGPVPDRHVDKQRRTLQRSPKVGTGRDR